MNRQEQITKVVVQTRRQAGTPTDNSLEGALKDWDDYWREKMRLILRKHEALVDAGQDAHLLVEHLVNDIRREAEE